MRTLIVDDEPGMRSLVAKVLGRVGAACAMAATAEEAQERLCREAFDVALLDIGLPGMDGLSLARWVHERHPDTALVMITGTTTAQAVLAAMQAGAADYVVKPFGADALLRAFDRAAHRRQVNLDAQRASGLRQAIAERTLEIQLLLSRPSGTAEELVHGYLAALRLRSHAAFEHAERVAELASAVGTGCGLPADRLEVLQRAAWLHDIGKFALPDTLLGKTAPLTDEELQIVRRHPEFGYEVLRAVPQLADCAEIVLAQLEHYDGSGTPLGVRGDRIPLPTRIVAVANAYDVMTHPRAYAQQQTSVEALQEIEACAGTQFDPASVTALLGHFGMEPRTVDWPADSWE